MGQSLSSTEGASSYTSAHNELHGHQNHAHGNAGVARTLECICVLHSNSQLLGKGTFGTVYKGQLRRDGRPVAIKLIEKARLKQMRVPLNTATIEMELLRECHGKDGFVQVHDFVETASKFCLIIELCDGGNLQDATMSIEGGLGEGQVRLIMQQILNSIAFLHSRSICHRDIKCHNFFLIGYVTSPSIRVKLGDFGTVVRLPIGNLLKDQIGTPAFMAPELHLLPSRSSGYDHKVDIWAAGVCLIFLLASEYPFVDGKGRLLRQNIIQGNNPLWEANAFQSLFEGAQQALGIRKKNPSRAARDLTRRLLAPRRQDRLCAGTALQHQWFRQNVLADDGVDNLPLLDIKDFHDAFSRMERDVGWALDALSKVQISAAVETSNERLHRSNSCVVCYNHADDFGRTCPRCRHIVCGHCIPRLPKSCCPYCRYEGVFDDAFQNSARYSDSKSCSLQRNSCPDDAKSMYGLGECNAYRQSPRVSKPHVFLHRRANACCLCNADSSMFDHVCPCCGVSTCASCICTRLKADDLRCPSCGEASSNAESMSQIAAWTNLLGGFINSFTSKPAQQVFTVDHRAQIRVRSRSSWN